MNKTEQKEIDKKAIKELSKVKIPYNMIFMKEGKKEVGSLDWTDGKLKFKGDCDESAKIFFDMIKDFCLHYYKEKNGKE